MRLSDQEIYRFALRLTDGAATQGGCFATALFDTLDGPLPGATLEILGNTHVFWANASNEVIDPDTFELYEPEDVRLTTRDGRVFDLNLAAGVTRITDPNGNQIDITISGIRHSSGREITFNRDFEGRIASITDPLGRAMAYRYDLNDDLESFSDRAGSVTRFTYDDDHLLIDIEDPLGVEPIRNEYDAEGRLVRHIDAFGRAIELSHDLENSREIITNRLGASRILEYDSRGNVTRETAELGKVTLRTFDDRDNLTAETDPLSRTTTYTYTAKGELATRQDPLGNTTAYTYDQRGRLLTRTDPRGGVAVNVYDDQGNLTQTTDAQGHATTFTYDTAGNRLTSTNALGQVTSFQYDAFGNQTLELDALGHPTVRTFDAVGNRLSERRTWFHHHFRLRCGGAVDHRDRRFGSGDLLCLRRGGKSVDPDGRQRADHSFRSRSQGPPDSA